ncbi:PorV/PorQ family protein [bacterium]|nr:PorV/PorQ family protein [bacterium]
MQRILPVTLFLFLLMPSMLMAQSGKAGLSFLKNGVGARNVAMGSTGVVSAKEGAASYYNPALLADDEAASISIEHTEWVQDITTEYVGIALPAQSWSFGVFFGITSVPGIELRDTPSLEPDGVFESQNLAAGVSAAFALTDGIDFGMNLKYLFEKIHVDDASGYGLDFGISARPFEDEDLEQLRFGLALSNVGSMNALNAQETTLPMLLRYGAGYMIPINALKSALNVEISGLSLLEEETTHASIGVEFDYVDMVFIRMGYLSGYDNKDISFGAGARYSSLRFDYAYVPWSDSFGDAHTIALAILF